MYEGAPAFSQTGLRQGFAESPPGVGVELDLGPWFEDFQLMELLGQLALGPVTNLAFSVVWVLEQGFSFLPCDGNPLNSLLSQGVCVPLC